ncbi:MAG TPA: peptidylprolyl isomerase [Terracidiphilus sp.]|nr:peptidylprolyl isomerase [Terracidiphilus sp.]
MRLPLAIRFGAANRVFGAPESATIIALSIALMLVPPVPGSAQTGTAMPLDRVVAVVNRQVILSSDIDDDIQLSVLDPAPGTQAAMSRHRALDELISRALIQQQIRREDLPAIQPTSGEVAARVEEIRRQLPACVRAHCETDAGWKAFLAAHGLTQYRVEAYLRTRMQILRFIEERFRQGIQISAEQIETYYRDTLLPQYPAGVSAPPLKQVSSRIEEILLEQQVNELFDNWLDNLRSQGDVEILDPALQAAEAAPGQGDGSE